MLTFIALVAIAIAVVVLLARWVREDLDIDRFRNKLLDKDGGRSADKS